MITPRDVRLVRVPHFRVAHRALAVLATCGAPADARDRAIVVATHHAAVELRRTLERTTLSREPGDAGRAGWRHDVAAALGVEAAPSRAVAVWPAMPTRSGFYEDLHRRLGPTAPPLLTRGERDAIAWHASDDAVAGGAPPPFTVRPGLVGEMLSLYDGLRRAGRSAADFERILVGALEPSADIDRGATRLLAQTRYLLAVFRRYEELVAASGRLDEHRLRDLALATPAPRPVAHVVLTLADQAAEPDGLWSADFDMLTRLPGLARIDVVATATLLDAGFRERLFELLPGIEERAVPMAHDEGAPALVGPRGEARRYFLSRDREEELVGIAREAVLEDQPRLDDLLVVYERPLPYVYLARRVFEDAGLPITSADALPLAAEPYASALDLVFDAVLSGIAREPLARLLSSRVISWRHDGAPLSPTELQAFREWCRETGYRGGAPALAASSDVRSPREDAQARRSRSRERRLRSATTLENALSAANAAATELLVLDREGPLTGHLSALLALLREREVAAGEVSDERGARARAAVLALLEDLTRAYARHGDRVVGFRDAVLLVRRAFEQHTFAPLDGRAGIRFADARSARYAEAARVWIVGVVEGEWPRAARRSVFYPSSLLRDLGFPSEQDRLPAARAAFRDLLSLPRTRTAVSAFQLEEDAVVRPSVLLEDLDDLAVPDGVRRREPNGSAGPVAPLVATTEAMRLGIATIDGLREPAARWLHVRARRSDAGEPRFHGYAGPPPRRTASVTEVERHLDCPFLYFASHVLDLDEEEDTDRIGLDPRRRGTLVHEAFRAFFQEWRESGRGAVTAATLDAARESWREVVEQVLAPLPEADRVIECTRLLGSSGALGFGERVFRLEAMRPEPIVERLLEYDLRGAYDFGSEASGPVAVRGIADRVDLLADGTFRLVDYKTGRAPDRDRAIQLAIYALCAEQKLRGHRGRTWRVGEAAYIALAEQRPWVAVVRTADDRRPLEEGRLRFLEALAEIARGEFPPAPADRRLCVTCAFAVVCRKEYRAELP